MPVTPIPGHSAVLVLDESASLVRHIDNHLDVFTVSRARFAERCQITPERLTELIEGQAQPSLLELAWIATELGPISIDQLLGRPQLPFMRTETAAERKLRLSTTTAF